MFTRIATALLLISFAMSGCMCHVVDPGFRSVLVTRGEISNNSYPPGLYFPFVMAGQDYIDVVVAPQKQEIVEECFSSDLQDLQVKAAVTFRIPESKVTQVYTDYRGTPFDTLIAPRLNEALKESTALRTAEQIVKDREKMKTEALGSLRTKVGDLVVIEDLAIIDVALSKQLQEAIGAKMVQEQEAQKAEFTKQKTVIEAEIARETARGDADATLLRAKADAESIRIRGDALRQNSGVVELQMIEKWNGVAPQIVAGSSGLNLLLPAAK